jgi:3-phenylpropionate/trans-cinnamate dioxygenase ferredoxin component
MADFVEAARLDQVPPGKSTSVKVGGKDVALFNVDGTVHAMDDTCPHAGSSLGMGKLDGKIVTCRAHGMKFDVTTGCFAVGSGFGVASYPVKVVDGKILVAVE